MFYREKLGLLVCSVGLESQLGFKQLCSCLVKEDKGNPTSVKGRPGNGAPLTSISQDATKGAAQWKKGFLFSKQLEGKIASTKQTLRKLGQ